MLSGSRSEIFLGFFVHNRGIKIDENKAKAILATKPSRNKKELQSFLGQINYLRRFISNAASKTRAFFPLLRLKGSEEYVWNANHQETFKSLKAYLSKPPVMAAPIPGRPLKLYIAAEPGSLGCLLAQDNDAGQERAIFYLSRSLNDVECNYPFIEMLCLALYFASIKLWHYFLLGTIFFIAQSDILKFMLSSPLLKGRISKWSLALVQFDLVYVSQKSIKRQALANFLAEHPSPEKVELPIEIAYFGLIP